MKKLIAASLALSSSLAMAQLATPTYSGTKVSELTWGDVECDKGVCKVDTSSSTKANESQTTPPRVVNAPCLSVTGTVNCATYGVGFGVNLNK